MITRAAIEERVREWGLAEEVVEKDYVLGWVLWGIGTEPGLADQWVFKGGTCLKKCYLETYRFSEDLDFTILPDGPILPADVEPLLRRALERATDASGIDFSRRAVLLKGHDSGKYTEGRVYYVGPRVFPTVSTIRLDLTSSETVVRPTVRRKISHAYPDELPDAGDVQCYSASEVFAEKIRALGERCRPRDLYDVINLYRRRELGVTPSEIRATLIEKCQTKGVTFPSPATILVEPRRAELEAEWNNMLAHQLPALPPLEDFIAELPHVFDWIHETRTRPVLPSVPPSASENTSWQAPATISTWYAGVPVESIRFAAVNHLCVDLKYQGTWRAIEPYGLAETRDGHLLLHAVRVTNRESRSYRLDGIEGVKITNQSFIPQFDITFSSSASVGAPGVEPSTRSISRSPEK